MPVALIGGGYLVFDYGRSVDQDTLSWIGLGLIGVGIFWGIIVWLWVSMRSW